MTNPSYPDPTYRDTVATAITGISGLALFEEMWTLYDDNDTPTAAVFEDQAAKTFVLVTFTQITGEAASALAEKISQTIPDLT